MSRKGRELSSWCTTWGAAWQATIARKMQDSGENRPSAVSMRDDVLRGAEHECEDLPATEKHHKST